MRQLSVKLLMLVLMTVSAGCATTQQKESRRFFWPQLPERPRIEWTKSYSSQSDFSKTEIEKFTASIIGETAAAAFDKPVAIVASDGGKVYVTDSGKASGVVVVDFNKHTFSSLGGENAVGQFSFPVGVALDAEDNVYVSDVDKKGVLVFDKQEKPLKMISTADQVQRNAGIAIDRKNNRLLVVDSLGHRIAVYEANGKYLFSFGERGTDDGKFNFPGPVTFNHQGEIIVGDTMNMRIQIFDGEGKFLRKFGTHGDGPADFQLLKGVSVDSDDNIYVTDGRGHKFIIFSTNGDYLMTVGGLYSALSVGREAPGGFMIPQGIFIDKKDVIYVVDQMNRRFQVFQYISDAYLRTNPIAGYVDPGGK